MSRAGQDSSLLPPKSRQELQKELAEVWAASKQQQAPGTLPSVPSTNSLLDPGLSQQLEELNQQRKSSNEHRKLSTDRKLSSDLSITGSQEKGADLWSSGVGVQKRSDQQQPAGCGADSPPCLRCLPYKAVTATLRRYPSIAIISALLFMVLTTGAVIGVMYIAANETHQRRLSAEGFAINAAVAFERQLAQMFFPLLSLATVVRNNPYYPKFNASFDAVAKELMEEMPAQGAVTHLIAAPQGVLRNFYPLSGYCLDKCDDINIDLFRNPERRDVALKTVKEGKLVMQGPMMLSQGYFGVVGRKPIYITPAPANETFGAPDGLAYNCSVCHNATTNTQFWGFVNALINLQSLVTGQDSRLKDLRVMGYLYEMYKYEKNGSRTEIARTSTLPTDPVQADVHVPGGIWFLNVSPESGWVPVWRGPIIAVVVLVCCLFSLLLGAILISHKLQSWLKAANDALACEKERMDVLLARQHNLISCVLQGDLDGPAGSKHGPSAQHRTLARIEDMRREIGVVQHTHGTSNGADEVTLSELLDEGTFGKVWRGLWRGSTVAVKTMVLPAQMSGAEKRERMAVMEAAISSTMQHPNIVQTYTYIIKPCSTSVGRQPCSDNGSSVAGTGAEVLPSGSLHLESLEASAAAVHNFEVSLVLEYCDWGSLRTALDAGAFFAEDNSLNYAAILDTAADIARAMLHLHKNQVLHSDLKARNVLLKSDASGRGCIAKVADFGLAQTVDCMETHVSAFQGTVTHLAPEALLHGHISSKSDVYAYGITLFELFTGGQAYQGIPRALVGHKVAVQSLRPTLPPFTPADFMALVEDCWHPDPDKRPSFDSVLARLVKMRADAGIPNTPPLQRYKLRPKSLESRHSSEKGVDVAAADAQAQGLMHLGSYYVNPSETCSTAPPSFSIHGDDMPSLNSSTHSSGSGDSLRKQLSPPAPAPQQQHGNGNGSSNGLAGSDRPAPRTSYIVSKLYNLPSQLDCIPDTEDLEGQLDEEGGPGTQPTGPSPGQQQQQSEQRQEPTVADKTAAAAPASCLSDACSSSSHTGNRCTSADMAAAADYTWPAGNGACSGRASCDLQQQRTPANGSSSRMSCDLQQQQQRPPANGSSSRMSCDLQQQQRMPANGSSSRMSCDLQQRRTPANGGSSRVSCDLRRQQQVPDIEQGRS